MLYEGDWLIVRAMRRKNGSLPAVEWYESLASKGVGQFLASAQVMETSVRSGRSAAGRSEKVRISRTGLYELKVTKPASTPPHLRALYIRVDKTLWVANGFTKQKNELEKSDVLLGDSIVEEWRSR